MKPAHKNLVFFIIAILFATTIGCATSSTKMTGLLQPKQGYIGSSVGAEVQRIAFDPETQITEIMVSVPRMDGNTTIEKVTNAEDKPLLQAKPYRIQKNADGESTGVILYLKRNNKLPFRIYFSDGESQ